MNVRGENTIFHTPGIPKNYSLDCYACVATLERQRCFGQSVMATRKCSTFLPKTFQVTSMKIGNSSSKG